MSSTDQFPYQDATLSIDQRVEDLLSRLELEDRVGLLFHTFSQLGDPHVGIPEMRMPSISSLISRRRINHFNVMGSASSGREMAEWNNHVQQIAMEHPLGIPVTLSSDPRNSFTHNPGTAMQAGAFSQWPEPTGLAAIGSEETVRRFADISRQEYISVGLRVALHPQIDLYTEPRWSRGNATFGEDADLTSRLVVEYIRGFQGEQIGPHSVSTMTKHFPGGGPQKDGEDPHFSYGREQVYPAGMFDYHLKPFKAAIAAGTRQIMPYYGMPVGTEYEEVGFGFNKGIITDLLRDQLGFDGIVCTDWTLLSDIEVYGFTMPARAWGVEDLTIEDRMLKALDAGVDQFGGELCTHVLLKLVREGRVTEARIDASARRLLREKFRLGLFENPYVDETVADKIIGCTEFREAGFAAQCASLTLLTNNKTANGPTLPLNRGLKIYIENIDVEVASSFGDVVRTPEEADVAILRFDAPHEPREGGFERWFHTGSLAFPDEELARIQKIAETVPTVVDIYLERATIVTELTEHVAALVADFGCTDPALLTVLFGDAEPQGNLPFELPRSMAAVEASREDAPFDSVNPAFEFGHGLRYHAAATPVEVAHA